ncbi:hypothetical protein [Mycobacterium sp. UM_CSW]|uniref:hypothetical protein n=1 Tax=Mycobacterium sp. UM_CSW TaxID=1370119 RepID=UPI001376FB48|nr:hypothetical protein [Mycobacterium sp. UM_CSW]
MPEEGPKAIEALIPMGRFAEPTEIADAVLVLVLVLVRRRLPHRDRAAAGRRGISRR